MWFLDTDVSSNLTEHEEFDIKHQIFHFSSHNDDDYQHFCANQISFLMPERNCNSVILFTPLAFIENVQPPFANGREVGRPGETQASWRPPLTTITVSKKRNWLQQSTPVKNHCTKDELQGMLGAEEEGSQSSHQPPAPPSLDQMRTSGGVASRPVRQHLPQVSLSDMSGC